jgi:dolichol-phosphate mannosyltransferase
MPKAVIIIPTYNEAKALPVTLEAVFEVIEAIKDWRVEVLIVDDTSPDKTYEVVQSLQKTQPRLHLLINPIKSGLGGAYLKGMAKSFDELKADVVFEFDADLSHDPTKIPSMLAKIDEGYDLVLASRYIPGGGIPENWGFHRKLLSILGNLTIKIILTNFTIADWTGGFRAITKKAYSLVSPHLQSERFAGYTFQIGFLQTALKVGLKITEVPFYFKDRTLGKSKIGPEYIKNALLFLIRSRLKEIMAMRLFKFVVVGGSTAILQLLTLAVFRAILAPWTNQSWLGFITPYSIATFIAIEMAVATNFTLSNLWTFADRQLAMAEIPGKFLQFNLASAGSILIQMLVAFLSEKIIGLRPLFVLPLVNKMIDSGTVFAIVGILIGMFWNFFAYTKIVWRQKA